MKDGNLIADLADHTEVYGYYTITSGANDITRPLPPNSIEEAGSADNAGYGVWVYPKIDAKSITVNVPGEKDGHTVSAVTISAGYFGSRPVSRNNDTNIKYLYIPSTVRCINIETQTVNGIDLMSRCKAEISPDNPYFCVYKNGIYSKDMTELYYIFSPREFSDGCFEVPGEVKRIRSDAGHGLKGLRRLIVPENVIEIEKRAFEYCPDLEYADISALKIGSRAFCSCNKLREVRLSAPLQKIEDHAFAYSDMEKLTLPPSVTDIGQYIPENDDPTKLTLEIYSNNGALPKTHGSPVEPGTLLTVLSPKTNEKLCEYVVLSWKGDRVFTKYGVDFAEYDLRLLDPKYHQSCKVVLRAAQVRLSQLNEADEDDREIFKHCISKAAFHLVTDAIKKHPDSSYDHYITSKTYLDLIYAEDLLPLIDEAALSGDPELTAWLMQYYHERKSRE